MKNDNSKLTVTVLCLVGVNALQYEVNTCTASLVHGAKTVVLVHHCAMCMVAYCCQATFLQNPHVERLMCTNQPS